MMQIDDEQLLAAIERIAQTADGRLLYLFLQRRLMATSTESRSGPLRVDHGERMFASKLIGLMAKGIQDSGGRSSSAGGPGGGSGEQPIVFAAARPVRVTDDAGTRRRIGPNTRISGYDRNDDAD